MAEIGKDDGVQTSPAPLLDPDGMRSLRSAISDFTGGAAHDALGLVGRAAQERGDITGALRELDDTHPVSTLVKLFLLGVAVPADEAATALAPLTLDQADALLEPDRDGVRARLELRPYSEAGGEPWWVVSDFGSDVRPGPLADDHVLGIGGASLTLAQATIRTPVGRALDIGTGSGVQALHLSSHADSVTATDLSPRALRLAATTAALSGVEWDLRLGSLLEPVADEAYDLIVANPPFVVSPGLTGATGGHDYRDSGLAGDGVCRELLGGIPARLAPGGSASMLANWIIGDDGDWAARVSSWVADTGCDAWFWQREVLSPGEYVALWLRDAGHTPGTPEWAARYQRWVGWFADTGVVAVGMGLVTLWKPVTGSGGLVVCEDVPQAVEQPAGAHLPGWITRQRWLADTGDDQLLHAVLAPPADLIRARFDLHAPAQAASGGWDAARTELRQSHGMRWELETDESIATLVGACNGDVSLGVVIQLLAVNLGAAEDSVREAALPVVRDLVSRGFLEVVRQP